MAPTVDERGRLYLPKDIREDYGEEFRIVRLHDGIKLLPIPEDPVEDLAEALEPVDDLAPEEIAEMRETLDDLR